MTAGFSLRLTGVVLLLLLPALLCACRGGGNKLDYSGQRPVIADLSTHYADIGDSLQVIGRNFGASQGASTVRLNGIDFILDSWSDTHIDVKVSAGMESGLVIVTVEGLSSMSGPAAYLSIPRLPTGSIHIAAVTPDFGAAGDEIRLTGSSFGSAANGSVFFPARDGAVSQDGGVVAAEIVTVDVDGTPVPQWSDTSITLLVPEQAQYGEVQIYIEVGEQRSNEMPFTVIPPGGQPAIHDVAPPNGPIGTAVTISGENFGPAQDGTTLMLGDFEMDVVSWSDVEISAQVPEGAVTAAIFLSKQGFEPAIWPNFIVGFMPVITAVSPSVILGSSSAINVHGDYFGDEQGSGQLTVGGVSQDVSNWSDALIAVNNLDSQQKDGELMVVVTNSSGLSSNEYSIHWLSGPPSFQVDVTVSPKAGQRTGPGGEPGTVFTFEAEVYGGSGDYEYYLIPYATSASAEASKSNDGLVSYTYAYDADAPAEEHIDTKMRVVDTSDGASLTVDGPTVRVVNYGVPVVTDIALADFNRDGEEAPNFWCNVFDNGSYHDFSFVEGMPLFTSSKGDIMNGGNPVPSYTRDLASFKLGGGNQRPYGYRYFDAPGSALTVVGLNFGDSKGQVFLNAAASNPDDVVEITDIDEWTDTAINFKLPPVAKRLSGVVKVVPANKSHEASSIVPLICSSYSPLPMPDPVQYPEGSITLSGFDFEPGAYDGITGVETYAIWCVYVSYVNPWGGGKTAVTAVCTTPIPPAEITGETMTFDMADIDVDHNGTLPVEVFNYLTLDEAMVVEGTPLDGGWSFFLWTGVLGEGSDQVRANSGIFSEQYNVFVGSQVGKPIADLQASPTSGDIPLAVDFDASASTDDGSISKFEFDFDYLSEYVDYGSTATAQHTYESDGVYRVQLRVTDDEGKTGELDGPLVIYAGNIPRYPFEVGVTINILPKDPPIVTTNIDTQIRLWNHPPQWTDTDFLAQAFSQFPGEGIEEVTTLTDIPEGLVWISLLRIVTDWDTGDSDFGIYGPYVIPGTPVVHVTGTQRSNPPAPGP